MVTVIYRNFQGVTVNYLLPCLPEPAQGIQTGFEQPVEINCTPFPGLAYRALIIQGMDHTSIDLTGGIEVVIDLTPLPHTAKSHRTTNYNY